ncbi:MAG: FixH family protein [Kibdelosporangium sp.]
MRTVFWAAAAVVVAMLALLLWPSSPEAKTFTVQTVQHKVKLSVDDPRQGVNTFDLEVTDLAGKPATVDSVTVELVMTQMGHALAPVPAARAEPGRFRAGAEITMPGQWEVTVSLPGSEQAVFPLLVD